MDKHLEIMINKYGLASAPITPQMFANAGKEHMEKYGIIKIHFAIIIFSRSDFKKIHPRISLL